MRQLLLALLSLTAVTLNADPRVDLLNPESLRLLDQPGEYSFATVLGLGEAEAEYLKMHKQTGLKYMRLDAIKSASPGYYEPIQKLIKADIDEIIAKSGETVAYSAEEAKRLGKLVDRNDEDGKIPRQFDYYWLESRDAAFPLVAVINRVDKRDFYAGTCGEVRFIYRIAYYRKEGNVESRSTLPLFLNVVYDYALGADGTCTEIAQQWNSAAVTSPANSTALFEALKNGPLEKSRITLKQIELNMQAMRYPSELKDDFGGQAIYLMRIFQDKVGVMTPIPLENTLDVAAIKGNKALENDIIAQVTANLDKVDNGTFVLNNTNGKLLATRALSFTTTGRARLTNKPFSNVFGANGEGLKDIKLDGTKFVKSAMGLVERLNNTTCMGCHQTGSTAGFHVLGRAGTLNNPFNQVILPFSPHYLAERTRRSGYIQDLSEAREGSTFRPPSFYPVANGSGSDGLPTYTLGTKRETCLPRAQTEFSIALRCGGDTECRLTAKNTAGGLDIGECVESVNKIAGNVCRRGKVTSAEIKPEFGDLYNLFAIKDKMDATELMFNDDATIGCTKPREGVPLGRISHSCKRDSKDGYLEVADTFTKAEDKPKELCVIQGGDIFDECAVSSNPPQCLEEKAPKVARAFLDTCSSNDPCREDYICQQLPVEVSTQYKDATLAKKVAARAQSLINMGVGFCVPNYFIFNMRADGHILPEGRQALVGK